MKLSLIGPPGSGKGTVSARLRKDFHYVYPGDLLRALAKKNTKEGREVRKMVESGGLVDTELTVKIVKKAVGRKRNVLLDGFPRSLEQVKLMGDFFDLVIFLSVSEKVVVRRFSGRRVCAKGHTYHVEYIPPQKEGICDVDGLKLFKRKDDTPAVVRNRFRVYNEQTKPVLKFFGKKVVKINANQKPEKVYAAVCKVLRRKTDFKN